MSVRRSEPHLDLLTKAYDHVETSCALVKEGNYRDFCSRFYYAYVTLLRSLYDCRGDWHRKDTYRGVPDNLNNYREKLRVWRIIADYERYGEHSWMDREEELIEFLCTDFLDILETIVHEIKSLRDQNHVAYLIIKKIREISRWLKVLRLTLEK